ncbi:MAG: WYL domain-containing protein [Thermodesulfobacteria bacterium]|nr:WYL domain-containing protein [Thermodesulfobacteriota bacterium]
MNKFDRLLYILNKLDQRQRVHPKTLAEELEVTERTIFRYLKNLQEAGFPIEYDPSRGTYTFVEGFSLQRALLKKDEILLLALARKILEPLLGKDLASLQERIEKKITARNFKTSDFTEIFGIQLASESPDLLSLLRDLSLAIKEHQIVEIEHQKEPGKSEQREIEPYFVFFTGDFWYVHAWCRTRDAQRTFALDKIRSWRLTDKYFLPRKDILSLEDIEEAFGPYVDEDPQEIVVHFSPEVKEYFLRRKWTRDQKCRELENGWLEVVFSVRGLSGFKHWLYRWLPFFRIVSPAWLAEDIKRDLKTFLSTTTT